MTDQTPKIPILQRPLFKKWLNPIVRGFVKQVPVVGTPLVELATTLTQSKDQPKKHSTVSMVIQWLIICAVGYDVIINGGTNVKDGISIIQTLLQNVQ